jgi:ATP-binding cassette subfamily B multidrug efflux pump
MLLRLLRTYLFRYRKLLIIVGILQLVQSIANLFLPSLNADLIDNGVLTGNTTYIWKVGGLMLAITLVQVCFAIGAVYFGSKAAMAFGRDVRDGLFHTVIDFSAQEVDHFGAPSLITRITNDVQQVQMLVVLSCTLLAAAPIMIVGGVIMALRENAEISLILAVAIPVLVFCIGLVVARMVPQFRRMQERIDDVNKVLREQITGIRVVRAFVREPDEAVRFGGSNAAVTDTALKAGRLMALMFPIAMLVINGSSVATVWFGANLISNGSMQIGQLIAFLSYLALILSSVMMATFMAVLIPRAAVCAERINEVLDTPSTVRPAENPVTELHRADGLELRDVEFSYPGAEEPVLCNISLRVRPGETTAIIGSTGAGKTSLLRLVPRLSDVTGGTVLIDGVDVRDLDLEVLWARIGLVPQKPYLFTGTVASNLRYADPNATDEELWEALTIAQAADFVRAMPEGLEGRIAQGGANVSGGQRQRLAIARALVRKPEIYLFDDSFSALDLATDARLRAALKPYTRNAAMVIVAQRVSTIADADQILVLEDGREVGLGTHDDLLDTCPTYAEIVASQNREEAVA